MKNYNNITLTESFVELEFNDGELVRGTLSDEWRDMFQRLKADHSPGVHTQSLDFSKQLDGKSYRINAGYTNRGLEFQLRELITDIPTFAELGIESSAVMPLVKGQGLTLFAGPMNSGKSTTLAAAICSMDLKARRKAVSIEDPLEYIYPGHFIAQREVGSMIPTAVQGVRDAMRSNARTIIIGEIRDPDTASAAVLAGLTGHNVLASIHGSSVSEAYLRMVSILPDQHLKILPMSLKGLFAQHLIRMGDNKKPLPLYESLIVTQAVKNILKSGPDASVQFQAQIHKQRGATFGALADKYLEEGLCEIKDVEHLLDGHL